MNLPSKTMGSRNDADFAPVRMNARMDRPPAMGFILIMGVAIVLVVGVIWADWAVLDEVTTGEGRVM